jgi:hypothetical protein
MAFLAMRRIEDRCVVVEMMLWATVVRLTAEIDPRVMLEVAVVLLGAIFEHSLTNVVELELGPSVFVIVFVLVPVSNKIETCTTISRGGLLVHFGEVLEHKMSTRLATPSLSVAVGKSGLVKVACEDGNLLDFRASDELP